MFTGIHSNLFSQNNTDVTDVNFNVTINASNPVDPGEFPGGPCRDGTISTTSFTVSGRDAVFNPRTGLYTVELDYVCLEKNTNYTISINYAPTDKNTTVYIDKVCWCSQEPGVPLWCEGGMC